MKKILAFSGSLSSASINHQLVASVAASISNYELNVIRLSDFPMPLYSSDIETKKGVPESTQSLRKLFDAADGFIISTPEYNGSIPAGLKNALDWISRTEGKIFQGKPVLLMATSPGGRGGASVLEHLSMVMPYWGAKVIGPFSLPAFGDNFNNGGISNPELAAALQLHLAKLMDELK
jgi:chromate reductase, NAD(P)H dehydrogenase (quinone)